MQMKLAFSFIFAAGALVSCQASSCEEAATVWCNHYFNCPIEHSGQLYALFDTNANHDAPQWRCYADSTLDPTHQHYVNGTEYCSRQAQISELLSRCKRGMVDTFAVFVHGETAANNNVTYPCIRIPAITSVPWMDSRLLAFAECRHWAGDGCVPTSTSGAPPNSLGADIRDMCFKSSDNNGATWSELQVIQSCAQQPTVVAVPPTPASPNGTIILQGVTCSGGGDKEALGELGHGLGPGRSIQFVSEDAGTSWSPPTDITNMIGPAGGSETGPGTGLRLADNHPVAPGRILFIGHHGAYVEDFVWYSDDGGTTYHTSNSSLLHMDEALLYVDQSSPRKDVVANMRNNHLTACKCRAESRSTDGGATFGPITFVPQLQSPVCQATLIDALGGPSPGAAYFANPATQSGRINGTIKQSSDGGHTWGAQLPISGSDGDFGYSCLAETFGPASIAPQVLNGEGLESGVHVGNSVMKSPVSEGLGLLWETSCADCAGPSCITAFTRIPWSAWEGA